MRGMCAKNATSYYTPQTRTRSEGDILILAVELERHGPVRVFILLSHSAQLELCNPTHGDSRYSRPISPFRPS